MTLSVIAIFNTPVRRGVLTKPKETRESKTGALKAIWAKEPWITPRPSGQKSRGLPQGHLGKRAVDYLKCHNLQYSISIDACGSTLNGGHNMMNRLRTTCTRNPLNDTMSELNPYF